MTDNCVTENHQNGLYKATKQIFDNCYTFTVMIQNELLWRKRWPTNGSPIYFQLHLPSEIFIPKNLKTLKDEFETANNLSLSLI